MLPPDLMVALSSHEIGRTAAPILVTERSGCCHWKNHKLPKNRGMPPPFNLSSNGAAIKTLGAA